MRRVDAAALRADPAASGLVVARTPAGLAAAPAAARAAGLHVGELPLARCAGKSGLLAALATALRLPTWFGHNWDALADCLHDLAWLPQAGALLVLRDVPPFSSLHPQTWATFADIAAEACYAHRTGARALIVLCDAPPRRPPWP